MAGTVSQQRRGFQGAPGGTQGPWVQAQADPLRPGSDWGLRPSFDGHTHAAGLAVSELNPAQVKFFGISYNKRTKNDSLDAKLIALYCLERRPMATRPL